MMTRPLFGWFVLVPVVLLMMFRPPLEAALAAAVVGALASASTVLSRQLRALIPLSAVPSAIGWGASTWIVARLVPQPWFVVAFPFAMVVATLPLRLLGAPRFVNNPLVRTQESWLLVVHTARFGGDLTTTALLATGSVSIALSIGGHLLPAALGVVAVLAVLTLGWASLRRATRRAEQGRRLRVAAVVVDGQPPEGGVVSGLWPVQAPEYRSIAGTLARYRPHVERAVRTGAKVVVLPEVSVYVDEHTRTQWHDGVQAWAREFDATIVAPFFDSSTPKNTLVVVDPSGQVGSYDKQHPARGLEPPCTRKMEVGPHTRPGGATLSTAICVDLDYMDTANSARKAGTVLAAPSNDWFGGFEVLHHRSAVWSAVIGGVPIVRATGHGISSIYDVAGRVLLQQTSAAGPVVLVHDVAV
jgi:predicted amidohydrolase